jgi:hypothetical protein
MKFRDFINEAIKPQQAKWNDKFLLIVKKAIPKIETPTPQDFWDTATYMYNQKWTPEEAAKKAISIYK